MHSFICRSSHVNKKTSCYQMDFFSIRMVFFFQLNRQLFLDIYYLKLKVFVSSRSEISKTMHLFLFFCESMDIQKFLLFDSNYYLSEFYLNSVFVFKSIYTIMFKNQIYLNIPFILSKFGSRVWVRFLPAEKSFRFKSCRGVQLRKKNIIELLMKYRIKCRVYRV